VTASSPKAPPPLQLRLALDRPPSYARADFVASTSNAAAVSAIDAWPRWPGGRLVLVGPEGSGKTHLARAWAGKVGAVIAPHEVPERRQAVLLEDADRAIDDATLFHLINMADTGATLMLTARTEPSVWPARLADLRSRLNALMVARIEAPDDVVLTGVMRKLFRESNIKPGDEVLAYLIKRIERSIPAVRDVVRRIDALADAEGREVTRTLARQILECGDKTLDLFE